MAGSAMSFSEPEAYSPARSLYRSTVTWTSDDSTGAVSGTSTFSVEGLLYGITTDPGSTAPTDNYDIALTDDLGKELLGGSNGSSSTDGNGANRDTSVTEWASASPYPIPVKGAVTVTITNAGNAKTGTMYIDFEKR